MSGQEAFGRRPGEVALDWPLPQDAHLAFIGRIRTPWRERSQCPKNGRESRELCRIELDPVFEPALQGLETCSHLWVLYWMDRAARGLLVQAPKHYDRPRGTFALRSPARPNPIALSAVELVRIEGAVLSVIGLDCLDGTPLIDLKPYFASTDSHPDARVGWHRQISTPTP